MTFDNITDEQILKEAETIFRENPQLRKCSQCVHSNEECSRCNKIGMPITRVSYCGLCPHWMTHEQKMIADTRAAMERHRKEEKKINHLLTMCLNTLDASMLFLEDFASRVEREYKVAEFRGVGDAKVRKADRNWMSQLKRAEKSMTQLIEGVRKQYQHYIMPIYNKVFMDGEQYNVKMYDDHQQDSAEVAHFILRYFDVAFLNDENANSLLNIMKGMSSYGVMEDKDINHYNLRR